MTWVEDDLPECMAVSLAQYVHIASTNERAFWGVFTPTMTQSECRDIWIQSERDLIERYLLEAQDEIEQILRYPMCTKWYTTERHPMTCPVMTKWGHVTAGGVRAMSTISSPEPVNHAADPAVVGGIATTLTDPDEVHVYYPSSVADEAIEITPSRVLISGGMLTIYIPRRLGRSLHVLGHRELDRSGNGYQR
jgi:hypothetical protein